MLLIPVGQENSEVRRHPWISYILIAVNVLFFVVLYAQAFDSDVPDRVGLKVTEVGEYLFRNPHLKVPDELAPYCGRELFAALEAARANSTPPVPYVVRRQQQRLNALTSELFAISREHPLLRHGYVPAKPEPAAALTSMFVHAGWLHLLGNLIFLFATGPFLEDVFGRFLFTLLYFSSGAAALAAHVWQNPDSLAPVVGASGAIAGIMGAFLVRLGKSRIRFLCVPILPFFWIRFRFLVPAFIFLPLWFIAQFVLATRFPEAGGGVALWAHIGGFVFGMLAAILIALFGIEARWINPSIEAQVSWSQNKNLVRAIEAQNKGDLVRARRATSQVLKEEPRNLDARRYAYEIAAETGDSKEAASQATRLLELYLEAGETDLARDLIQEASGRAMEELPLRFLQRAASFLDKQGDREWAVKFYDRIAEGHPQDLAALRALLRSAEILHQSGDERRAREAIGKAAAHPECAGQWKQAVDKKLAELEGGPSAPPRPARSY